MTCIEGHDATIISIKGLRLDSVSVPNIWGDTKPQPASLNVDIQLHSHFKSAASADALDDSTIHYGELAKSLRAACSPSTGSILEQIFEAAEGMAGKHRIAKFIASRISIELVLPKASAYGSALSLRETRTYSEKGERHCERRVFSWKAIRIMTLIGVNAYERRDKQPLVVDLNVVDANKHKDVFLWSQPALINYSAVERDLVKIIEETAFETLESLADHVLREIGRNGRARGIEVGDVVHIRFEKPAAIPFADAPVIEVKRRLT